VIAESDAMRSTHISVLISFFLVLHTYNQYRQVHINYSQAHRILEAIQVQVTSVKSVTALAWPCSHRSI